MLEDVLLPFGKVATRRQLVAELGRHRFDNLVKRRELFAVFPRVYCYPWDADQPDVRRQAALLSVGGEAALSHLTSLDAYGLPTDAGALLHVTAYLTRHPRGVVDELIVHRTQRPLDATLISGVPVVRLEQSLVSSWPLLAGPSQRAPIIEAARRRIVSVPRLAQHADAMWWIAGIRDVRQLIGLLLAGCESPLEMYSYLHVFDVPGLIDAKRQRVVEVDGRTIRLDIAYEEQMLNVELDGREFHESAQQWDRDIARDVLLARLGWQTVRLSHRRLHDDVDRCRRDVLQIREARRLQMGARSLAS